MAYGALSVLVTAVAVPAAGFTVTVTNTGAAAVFRGDDSSVTTATGTPIQPGASYTFTRAAYLIGSATTDTRWITESS